MNQSAYDKLSAGQSSARHSNIYIHRIITLLKQHTRPVAFGEIEKETGIGVKKTPGLLALLEKNKKLVIKDETLEYVPTHSVATEKELLQLLESTQSEHGISLEEILDANSDIMPYVQRLVSRGDAIVLRDTDGSSTIFRNAHKIPQASYAVQKLYEEIQVPDPRDLARELAEAGLASKAAEARTGKPAAAQRKKAYGRRIKVTNTHLNKSELGM